jgi:hypothetical protein
LAEERSCRRGSDYKSGGRCRERASHIGNAASYTAFPNPNFRGRLWSARDKEVPPGDSQRTTASNLRQRHGSLERSSRNSTFRNRRAVGILQLFAEEEAAKSLLLFDAVRCPRARKEEFRRLVSGFGNHLAKGIYVKYYGSRLADLHEARTIVNLERRAVYREGDYGEFIAPNSILYMREKRVYVSYAREDDNRHGWHQPYLLTSCSETSYLLRSFA